MNSYSKHSLDNFIPIGKIIKPKGLKGEVKVFLYNIDSNSVKEDISFFINTKKECFDSYKLERFCKTSKYHLLKFHDIDDRDKAFNICDKNENDLPGGPAGAAERGRGGGPGEGGAPAEAPPRAGKAGKGHRGDAAG